MRKITFFVCLASLLAGCGKFGPHYSPRAALATFQIEKGYRIEPFAGEPDAVSPVSMEIDYVVEDRGYPLNVEGKLGRVKLLRDTNGDGIPDKIAIFADQLVLPTGVMRWKKGCSSRLRRRVAEQHCRGRTEPGGAAATLESLNMGRWGLQAGASGRTRELLLRIFETGAPDVRRAALRSIEIAGLPQGAAADRLLQRAQLRAGDAKADAALRADSIGLLAAAAAEEHAALFESLIDRHQPEPVQVAAARAYGRVKGERPGAFLLRHWRALTPAARSEAADALYLDTARERMLVAALKSGQVPPWTLAFRHKRRLIMHNNPATRRGPFWSRVRRTARLSSKNTTRRSTAKPTPPGDAKSFASPARNATVWMVSAPRSVPICGQCRISPRNLC